MIFEDRFCDYCRRRIAKRKRADARFCSHRCKLAAQRQRARTAQAATGSPSQPPASNDLQRREKRKPFPVAQLARLLVQYMPAGAVGYRLAEQFRSETGRLVLWYYPPKDRPFRRHDGTFLHRPYFLLQPFEPPVVPISGPYGVEYIQADGTPFPMVLELAQGVVLEAGPYPVRIEDGERE